MCRGDRITIKSTYIRWKNLPVGNHGASVSVMAIKATGTITENLNDGKTVKVDWVQQSPTKSEWHFHTWLVTVSKIQPGDWKADALLPFSFDGDKQPVKRFLETSPWREKYGRRPPIGPYCVDSILDDGSFLERNEIQSLLDRLEQKKNLALQGPPGTGKTWIGRRLAYALRGTKDSKNVRVVQFHPNYSYEDFVRGLQPRCDGKPRVADGAFMEAAADALKAPESKFFVVIEEINRGNPAQIFGELITLLEADKRKPSEAIRCPTRARTASEQHTFPRISMPLER